MRQDTSTANYISDSSHYSVSLVPPLRVLNVLLCRLWHATERPPFKGCCAVKAKTVNVLMCHRWNSTSRTSFKASCLKAKTAHVLLCHLWITTVRPSFKTGFPEGEHSITLQSLKVGCREGEDSKCIALPSLKFQSKIILYGGLPGRRRPIIR